MREPCNFSFQPGYVFLIGLMLFSEFGFFRCSTWKLYRRLSLDSHCGTTRAELFGVTHGGTKTRVGSGIELTTSHKA
ncbi:hypothetical protein Hanom_Chr05g00388871 [Helianthus anomalus]